MFAFNPDGTPIQSNHILVAGSNGDISGQDILTVLRNATNDQASGDCVTQAQLAVELEDVAADILDASNAYVTPLADLSANVYAAIATASDTIFYNNATYAALMDLSANVHADLSGVHRDISAIVLDISACKYTVADLSANLADLATDVTDISGRLAAVYTDLSASIIDMSSIIHDEMLAIVAAVDAKIGSINSDISGDVTFRKTTTFQGQLLVDLSGSPTDPAISFVRPAEGQENNSDTGIYHPRDGQIAFGVDGAHAASIIGDGLSLTDPGTAARSTGIYKRTSDATAGVDIAVGGSNIIRATGSSVQFGTNVITPNIPMNLAGGNITGTVVGSDGYTTLEQGETTTRRSRIIMAPQSISANVNYLDGGATMTNSITMNTTGVSIGTSNTTRMTVTNSNITTTVPVIASGDVTHNAQTNLKGKIYGLTSANEQFPLIQMFSKVFINNPSTNTDEYRFELSWNGSTFSGSDWVISIAGQNLYHVNNEAGIIHYTYIHYDTNQALNNKWRVRIGTHGATITYYSARFLAIHRSLASNDDTAIEI